MGWITTIESPPAPAEYVMPEAAPDEARSVPPPLVEDIARAPGHVGKAVARHLGAIVVFSLPAVVLWWHAWNGHLGSTLACACGDSGQQVWFVAWPAYALSHGLDPFSSSSLWAPHGVNLLSNASFPLVGTILAPLTLVAGPVVSTNVALTLAPALSAWACWVTCRRMVAWRPAAWIAGFIFGYSAFVVDNDATGHIGLALLVCPPLMLAAAYELARGKNPNRWGIALGLLIVAQFMISTEVLAVCAVVGVVGATSAAVWNPRWLVRSWRRLVRGGLVALVLATVVLIVPFWFALFGSRHISGPPWPGLEIEGNRVIDLVAGGATSAPNPYLELGGYEGPAGPPSVYLGAGILCLFVGAVACAWRRRATRVLATTTIVTVVFSLGAVLWTPAREGFGGPWMPWRLLGNLPLLKDIGPQRFSALGDLLLAVVVALGLDAAWRNLSPLRERATREWRPRRRRGAAVACGTVVFAVSLALSVPVWPMYHAPLTTRSVAEPRWVREVVPTARTPKPVLLVYPVSLSATAVSAPLVWQSLDNMAFDLATGYIKVPGPSGSPLRAGPSHSFDRLLVTLTGIGHGPRPSGGPRQISTLRRGLVTDGVTDVVITNSGLAPAYAAELFSAVLGVAPVRTANAWTFGISAGPATSPLTDNAANASQALVNCRRLFGTRSEQWNAVAATTACIVKQAGVQQT